VPLGPAHTVGLGDAAAFTHIFQNADIVSYVESLAPSLKNVDLDEVRRPQVCWSHQWDNAECQVDTEHPHVAGVNSDLALYVWGDAYNGYPDEGATYWHQLRYVRGHDLFEATNYTEPH
jgi:predicted NAD/FAD-dependent oxidoreductase